MGCTGCVYRKCKDCRYLNNVSNIVQLDGNVSDLSKIFDDKATDENPSDTDENLSDSDDENDDNSDDYETDDELDPVLPAANLVPSHIQLQGEKVALEVSEQNKGQSNLPLCLILNSRSLYNKANNFKKFLYEISPDISIVSETWERQGKNDLQNLLASTNFKVISYKREKRKYNRQPGGGCAIVFNERKFQVSKIDLYVPEGVEATWALFTPLTQNKNGVKKIAVGSFYVSPNSVYKTKTLDHIMSSIHQLRSEHGNDLKFLLGGDLNRLNITRILDSYSALKQVVAVPTRKTETLEVLLTDMPTLFHPPTTLDPLQVDEDKQGSDSDHLMVIFAPILNQKYKVVRQKKTIITRPLPEDKIKEFGSDIVQHD